MKITKEPVFINHKLCFLGEIPTYFEFEKRNPVGVKKNDYSQLPDFVMDDTALAYNTGEGLFIITGCSHSGICSIIEHAKKVCQEKRIKGVLGGFHLFNTSEKLTQTIDYFKKNNINQLYPCHCISFAAKAEIHKKIPIVEVGVGLSITI